jgi:16S rRNA processing protein RimM
MPTRDAAANQETDDLVPDAGTDRAQLEKAEPVSDARTDQVLAAQVAGAFGISGVVRLRLIGSQPDVAARSLRAAGKVRLARSEDDFERVLTLTSLSRHAQAKGAWLARFEEVATRTEAELLYGCSVFVPESLRPSLPDGEYYVDELVGLAVVTDTGRDLGRLRDVLNTPANDVYVTDKDVLIPVVAAFVLRVDLGEKTITVRDTPGLADDL